jgi:hypothetical protein
MTTARDLLQQAATAIKAGDKEHGKQLLLQISEADERCVDAWPGLAPCVDDPQLKRKWLERALEIDPANQLARRRLRRLDFERGQILGKCRVVSQRRRRFWRSALSQK